MSENNQTTEPDSEPEPLEEKQPKNEILIEEKNEDQPEKEVSKESFENTPIKKPEKENCIFVVHGKNNLMKEQVSCVLNEFKLKPVFTQDQSNAPKPIAQKIFENPDIISAIVLLSGDDFVYSKEEKPHDAFLRANQKIVFELGFWIAKFGREHVIALYLNQKSFRPPTEYSEAIYIPFDKTSPWKTELIARLKQWGYAT